MKSYHVFTHEDLRALRIEAPDAATALTLGLKARKGVTIPGGYFGAECDGSDGPLWVPARPAVPLAKPYAWLLK